MVSFVELPALAPWLVQTITCDPIPAPKVRRAENA
jgi:hypothetical protein